MIEKSVKMPPEFRDVALKMHQDVPHFLSMKDEGEIIDCLADGVSPRNSATVAEYIDGLLRSALTARELTTLWVEAGADLSVSEHGIVHFLTILRDRLRQQG